jgi:hypothetical protein
VRLEDLEECLPEVACCLDNGSWCGKAEQMLLETWRAQKHG